MEFGGRSLNGGDVLKNSLEDEFLGGHLLLQTFFYHRITLDGVLEELVDGIWKSVVEQISERVLTTLLKDGAIVDLLDVGNFDGERNAYWLLC